MHGAKNGGDVVTQLRQNTSGPPAVTSARTDVGVQLNLAASAPNAKIKWAGIHSSPYRFGPIHGTTRWPSPCATLASYFPGATPIGLWLVGEIYFAGSQSGVQLGFPNPGGVYDPKIRFADLDHHEHYLNNFDAQGIKVFLQVEPGYADPHDLIDAVFRRYGHHPCVAGFGVDAEWYHSQCNGCENARVTDALAWAWEAKVKSYHSHYRLVLKHFEPINLPPTYRGDLIFVDRSERHGNYTNLLADLQGFADFFYPNDVMFQIGYPSDKSWWSALPAPIPQTIGQDLARQTRQPCGIVWVDLSLPDVLPIDLPEG